MRRRWAALMLALMTACAGAAAGPLEDVAVRLDADVVRSREESAAGTRLLGVSSMEHAGLRELNGDYVAWLAQEGTLIDYPITQCGDNSFYLTHSFSGEESRAGCLFLDYRNGGCFQDELSAVYGHHMKDDSMLATLVEYKRQSYYDAHPTLALYTPWGDYDVKLFAGVIASGKDDFLQPFFGSDEEFDSYWSGVKERSTFDSDVTVERGDRVLALVTCTYEFDNARYIVFGRMDEMK
ncbi:MAG: class B sortase [Candidatus Fimadaptatus sp.]